MIFLHLADHRYQRQEKTVATGMVVQVEGLLIPDQQFFYSLFLGAVGPEVEGLVIQQLYQGVDGLVCHVTDIVLVLELLRSCQSVLVLSQTLAASGVAVLCLQGRYDFQPGKHTGGLLCQSDGLALSLLFRYLFLCVVLAVLSGVFLVEVVQGLHGVVTYDGLKIPYTQRNDRRPFLERQITVYQSQYADQFLSAFVCFVK